MAEPPGPVVSDGRPTTDTPPVSDRRPGFPREFTIGLVVGVALLLILSVALLEIPHVGPSSGGGLGYSAADAIGSRALPNGTWTLLFATGEAPSTAEAEVQNYSTHPSSNPNCVFTPLVGSLVTSFTVPAFHGSLESGLAPMWFLDFFQASTGDQVTMTELNGTVIQAVEDHGAPDCSISGATLNPLPANLIDSPEAVYAADNAGGGAFLAAHPTGVSVDLTLENYLIPGLPGASGQWWFVDYTTCPLATNGTTTVPRGETFTAAVNATTGLVRGGTGSINACGGPTYTDTVGAALKLGSPTSAVGAGTGGTIASQGCTSGDYCVQIPITSTSENITFANFTMNVTGGPHGSGFPVAGFAITNGSGAVIVYSLGASETQWSAGVGNSETLLTSNMTMWVDTGTTNIFGEGYVLTIVGTGAFQESEEGIGLAPSP
jgi:hypothetical protein